MGPALLVSSRGEQTRAIAKLAFGRMCQLFLSLLGHHIRKYFSKAILIFSICLNVVFAQPQIVQSQGVQSSAIELAQARDLLRQAYKNAPPSDEGGNTEAWLLADIAESFADLGDVKEALSIAKAVKGEPKYDEKGRTLQRIVLAVDRSSGLEAASQLAEKIRTRELNRDQVFLELTEAHIRQGDLIGALRAADHISAASLLRNKAYAETGIAYAKAGDLKNSLHSVRFTETSDVRVQILQHVAIAQARVGKIDDAISKATQIASLEHKVNALCGIAVVQAKSGKRTAADDTFRIALKEIAPFEKEGQGSMALVVVAAAKAKSGDFEGAKAIAEKIEDIHQKDQARFRAVIEYAESGHPEEAWEAAKLIVNPYSTGEARAKVVRVVAQSGQLHRAEVMVEEMVDHIYAPIAQYYIVAMQARLGHFEEAEKTVGQVRDPYNQAAARHALAMAYARAGKLEEALDVVS
jgi:tetratricopeptide (TPR) repeat protein